MCVVAVGVLGVRVVELVLVGVVWGEVVCVAKCLFLNGLILGGYCVVSFGCFVNWVGGYCVCVFWLFC